MKDEMCCFDGYAFDVAKEKELKALIEYLIKEEGVKRFCFLQKSKIDTAAMSILKELKKTYQDISLGLVFPNIDTRIEDFWEKSFDNYDFFLTDKISFKTPNGWSIKKWNHYMVDCSEYLICYVKQKSGNAFDTLEYAKSKGDIKIFNIAEI